MTPSEKLLCDLIALPSVNPAFLPTGNPRAGEERVGDFLAATAARAGVEPEFHSVSGRRKNLLIRLLPPARVRRRVLLAPHLDTVNGTDDQFRPRRSGGRIYGRGACDTKGSVTAMLGALLAVARGGARPNETEIIFAGLVDEEDAQRGSRALVATGFRADLGIVGEPTRLQVVTAHKGSLWLRLATRGKSAHGATPELGRNAVHEMARIVDVLQTEYSTHLKRRKHPLLGCASVSVGAIAGGTQANIVPDECSILVDRRTLPGETERSAWREIRAFLKRRGLKASLVNGKVAPCSPLETDARLPLVAKLLRSQGQRRPVGVHYFCDAAILAEGGIPSVVFGPGDIAQAHTSDEWISVRSLEAAKDRLAQFLRELS